MLKEIPEDALLTGMRYWTFRGFISRRLGPQLDSHTGKVAKQFLIFLMYINKEPS